MAQENLANCRLAAKEGKISLFYLDESGFSNIPNVQRAWSPKGQPHQADASTPRGRINVIGALDWATGNVWHHLQEQTVKRKSVVDFIDRIAKREERKPLTLVVLDNARIHHGMDQAILDDWLVNHRLVLMYLPPYSPELNPIEIVWKQAKYHWRRFVTWTKEELFNEVLGLMQNIGVTFKVSYA